MKRPVLAANLVLLALAALAFAASFALPFGEWKRVRETPVLGPQGNGFESAGVFNPAVVKQGNAYVMLYRAQDAKGTSRLGYATSADGVHFTRRAEPVLVPETEYEKDGGVEDPRLVQIGELFYLTYTGYNKKDAQLCLATSKDLIHWDRKGVVLPAYQGNWNVGWTKSGAILPHKVAGRYWMYFLGTAADKTDQMGLAFSTDLLHWTEATAAPVLEKRPGKFDSRVVEPGPPPVLLPEGILLTYNGADDHLIYATGWALFDRKDPRRVLARSERPIFWPEKDWEKIGQVPNVVFVEGLVRESPPTSAKGGQMGGPKTIWHFYYGGADKYVGVAEATGP